MSAHRALLLLALLSALLGPAGRAADQTAGPHPVRLVVQPTPPGWLASLVREACRLRLDPDTGRAADPLAGNESRFAVSPDSRRVAYVTVTGEGACVVVDGKEGPVYEEILESTLAFSPDGRRLAYGARSGGKCFVVVDGQAGRGYDAILAGTVVFSPDGKRLAYGAQRGAKTVVVVDGQEDRPYDAVLESTLIFSPDGRQVAYGARTGAKAAVVINGKEGAMYDAILEGTVRFSAAGRLAYGAVAGGKAFVVAFGKEEQKYAGILRGTPVFSPDGKRLAYGARLGAKCLVVVDGKAEKQYDFIGAESVTFSPDGRHLAYVAGGEGRRFLVLDGKEERHYDAILGPPVFSPDGRHLAYLARQGKEAFAVLDGQAQKKYDGVGMGSLLFSADGKRLAYSARSGGKWFVVADGREQKAYDCVGSLAFSPDGRQLAYAAYSAGRACVVVEGKEEAGFEGILAIAGAGVVFESPARFHYLALSGGHIYLAGNYPQLPEDEELEKAIAALRQVRLDSLEPIERWHKRQEIDRAWAVVRSRGERGQARLVLEIEQARSAGDRDDFFLLNAAALLWQLNGLDQAGAIAGIWRATPLAAHYEYVFPPAFEAAQTRDARALPMLLACLRDTEGQIYLGEHSLELGWPQTQEFLWGAYGAKGLPVLAGILGSSTEGNELQSAMLILADAMYQPALPQIRKFALDQRSAVRGTALVCLGMYGHPQDYDLLVDGLAKIPEDILFRLHALGLYGDLRAVPAMTELLRTREEALSRVRMAAIAGLQILLTPASLEALQKHAKTARNPAEQAACQDFLAYFLGQVGLTWEQFARKPKSWKEEAVAGFRNRDYTLKAGERALTHDELVEVAEEWKRSRSIAGSTCNWVGLRHLLPAATPNDLEILLEVRAAFYTRLSGGCLADVAQINRLIQRLARSQYRKETGITEKAEGI